MHWTCRKPLGASELTVPLVSMSTLSAPLLSSSTSPDVLGPGDVVLFLQDLASRFDDPNELAEVLGPVVRMMLLTHPSLWRLEGLAGADNTWRGILAGLEALVSIKSIAIMITQLPEWNPPHANAHNFEHLSLMGPLLRLGVFDREWVRCHFSKRHKYILTDVNQPYVGNTYFSNPEKRHKGEIDSFFASLRGTLKTLQVR
jgi:ubiquitin conjugation factor E4 B